MKYQFPHDLTLDEVRVVVDRHNERTGTKAFIAAERDDHVVFNYLVSFEGSFPEPNTGDLALDREFAILRECRGLIMCKSTGQVLARRYHKFFNVNQRESTQAHVIDWSQTHWIMEKLDGSMITPFFSGDRLRWGTKMGATEVAGPVEAFVAERPQYEALARDLIWKGMTPIFEWCSRQQKIVIDYPEDKLVLVHVRWNHSGAYESRARVEDLAAQYDIPVVRVRPGSVENIQMFLDETRDLKGEEGFVIQFADGHMVKVKAEEYCRLHNTKEMLQFEKDVIALVLSDSLDDAKAFMDEGDRARVDAFCEALEKAIRNTADEVAAIVEAARAELGTDKKRFAIEWVNGGKVDPAYRGFAFSVWDGKDAFGIVRNAVKLNCGTSTKVNEIRPLIGGLNWNDYRDHSVVIED